MVTVRPRFIAQADPGLIPASLWTREYLSSARTCKGVGELIICLTRPDGTASRFTTLVPPEGAMDADAWLHVERKLTFEEPKVEVGVEGAQARGRVAGREATGVFLRPGSRQQHAVAATGPEEELDRAFNMEPGVRVHGAFGRDERGESRGGAVGPGE
ncbi:MAG: hypothetical protein ACKOQ9_07270, partial [Verrucomicrobiota bacterium]